jgi:hypothetical protein
VVDVEGGLLAVLGEAAVLAPAAGALNDACA